MRKGLIPLIVAAACGLLVAAPPKVETLAIGAKAPPFSLKGVDGKTWTLDDVSAARILVLVFTCNHCPDARAASGRIREVAADYKDKGVTLVAISGNDPRGLRLDEIGYSVWGDSFEEMKHHAKENGWEFPYLYDGDTQQATKAYGAQATPHVFVFDAGRQLRYTGRMDDGRRNPGPVEKSQLRDALDAMLTGKAPDPAVTRPVGCSTKWAWKSDAVAKDNAAWEALPVSVGVLDVTAAGKLRANGTDKLRLVNLWSTGCAPCIAEFPELVATYRRFQNRPFEFISISLDAAADHGKVEKILRREHAAVSKRTERSVLEEGRKTNNYRFDGDADALADAIDPEWSGALPHSALIAPGGKIVWRHNGEVDPVELRRAIVKWMDQNG